MKKPSNFKAPSLTEVLKAAGAHTVIWEVNVTFDLNRGVVSNGDGYLDMGPSEEAPDSASQKEAGE